MHRFSAFHRNRPQLTGGAALSLPSLPSSAETAIDRHLDELREIAREVEPIHQPLDTGPPRQPVRLAA